MWFTWNGIDSRSFGLLISKLPSITRGQERVDQITIPGRSGHLIMKQGDDVRSGYRLDVSVILPIQVDEQPILAWLTGSGSAVFANDPTRCYDARIIGEVSFVRASNTLKTATIPFWCQPYKAQYPTEGAITLTGTTNTVTNPGDVASKPKVTIDTTGDVTVTIGGVAMAFSSLAAKIIVDCDAHIITNNDGTLWTGTYTGNFWKLPKGQSTVTASKSCTIKIEPRWRWL